MKKLMSKMAVLAVSLALIIGFVPMDVQAGSSPSGSETPMTYLANGGSYNLEYILNKLNIFTSGTVRASHVYGPIIAGGEAGKGNDESPTEGFTFSDYDQGISSYIGGKIHAGQRATGAANDPAGCNQNEYVGTVNAVSSSGGNGYVNGDIYLYSNTKIYNTDSYVDFDAAFASIQSQSDSIYNSTTKELGIKDLVDGKYLYVTEGQFAKLSDELIDYNSTLYAKDKSVITVVLVTDSADASNKVNTVISAGKSGSIIMPAIHISNSVGDPGTLYPSSMELNKNGTSLIWNCPKATRLDFTNQNGNGLGHVVAPQADIYNLQGTYSGCQVCRNFYGNRSEGHMQPYNSTEIKNTTTVTKTVKKVWDDAENQDGIRPGNIQVQLYAGNTASGGPVTLNAANGWSHTWSGLDKEKDGQTVNYSVKEVSTPVGYASKITETGDTFTVTNTHATAKVNKSVKKVWDDSDNADGIRPKSIQVQLYAGDEVSGDPVTLNADNQWSYTWNDIAEYKAGKKIVYTVKETSKLDKYTSAVTEVNGIFTVTNTHKASIVNRIVNKLWNDGNNQDGIRPVAIQVQLYANKVAFGDAVTLSADDGWTHTWNNLLENSSGKAIDYTIAELNTPEGYTSQIAESGGTFNITNTHATSKVDKSVKKIWNDNNNQDGLRTGSIQVQLYADDAPFGDPVTLSSDNDWQHTWNNLDVKKDNKNIVYTVKEVSIPKGYTSSIDEKDNVFTITNTHEALKIDKSVKKVWDDNDNKDGIRPESIKVQLYADNVAFGDPVTLNADNNWSHKWSNLDTKAGGKSITYTVKELNTPAGYTSIVDERDNTFTVTNAHATSKVDKSVKKIWDDNNNQDGIRPGSIKVQLYADNVASGEPVTLNADNNWSHKWSDLDAKAGGNNITYTVKELNTPAGYTSTSIEKDNTFTITNTHTVTTVEKSSKVNKAVEKVWNDSNDQDGLRPENIKVQLYADGVKTGNEVTLDEDNNWTYTWTDLDEESNGNKVTYTVQEVTSVTGYISSTIIDGNTFIITNTHKVNGSGDDDSDHSGSINGHSNTNNSSIHSGADNLPNTGDSSDIALWIMTVITSLSLILVLRKLRALNQ